MINIIKYFENKYESFKMKIQMLDSEVFFMIPQIIVLHAIKEKNYSLCLYLSPISKNKLI